MATHRQASGSTASITNHRLFPAIVGLWFAALFGLGSLAVRASVLESAVLAIGLDRLIPAAAPPLGVTARILLALAMAAIGAVAGTVLALRLFRGRPAEASHRFAREDGPPVKVRARDAHPDAPVRRPLSISEDCDEDAIARPAPAERLGGRRRSLTLEESAPSEFLDYAPLPGGPLLHGRAEEAQEQPQFSVEAEPFELTEPEPEQPAAELQIPAVEAAPVYSAVSSPARPFDAAPSMMTEPEPQPAMPEACDVIGAHIGEPVGEAQLDGLSALKLTERLAVAMQRRREREAAAAAAAAEAEVRAQAVAAAAAEALAAAQAAALAKAEADAEDARVRPAPLADPAAGEETAAAEPEAVSFRSAGPAALPAALRPIGFGDDDADEEDGDLTGLVPPRHFQIDGLTASFDPPSSDEPLADAEPTGAAEPRDPIDEEALEDGYSSLLGLSRRAPAEPPFVRVPDPEPAGEFVEPVVIFPGQGPRLSPPALNGATASEAQPPTNGSLRRFDAPGTVPPPLRSAPDPAMGTDPEETARALRSALATLQRMSGAA